MACKIQTVQAQIWDSLINVFTFAILKSNCIKSKIQDKKVRNKLSEILWQYCFSDVYEY